MSYVTLYRKYRSQSFADLVEQQAVVKTLQNAVRHDRIAHAYIFSGPRGTGKTSVARIFAKTLNCLNLKPDQPEPCNECDNCRAITRSEHMDVTEIDAASHTGVDHVRDLIEKVHFLPTGGKYKIYIIDETHMLSTSAFNALLKTIEEPPSHVLFILATTDPHKIPVTIQSRCQRLEFSKISQKAIVDHVSAIAKQEGLTITDQAMKLIAAYSGGHLRDALSMVDQLISYVDDTIDVDAVVDMMGTGRTIDMVALVSAVQKQDLKSYFSRLDDLFYRGLDPVILVTDLLTLFRHALFFKLGLTDLIVLPQEELVPIRELSEQFDQRQVQTIVKQLSAVLQQLRYMEDSHVYLQVMLLDVLSLPEPAPVAAVPTRMSTASTQRKTSGVDKIADKKSRIVEKVSTESETHHASQNEETAQPKTKAGIVRPDVVLDMVNVKHHWPDVLAYLKNNKKATISAMLREGVPLSVENQQILLGFEQNFKYHCSKLNETDNKTWVDKAASEVFQRPMQVSCELSSKEKLPIDLGKHDFNKVSFMDDELVPESVKSVAQAFEVEAVDKVEG